MLGLVGSAVIGYHFKSAPQAQMQNVQPYLWQNMSEPQVSEYQVM